MDENPQFEPEFSTEASLDAPDSSTAQYTGAFFPRAKDFVVAGGNFKSVTHIHQAAPSAFRDFPVIPLGHVNLLHQIELHGGSGVVRRGHGRPSVRRMYSAQIHGCKSKMTVALYQGEGAEDRWRVDLSRYIDLRHPYLAQLYGIVRTAGLHGAVLYDDLICHTELLEKYRNSHFSTVFFWASMAGDFSDVQQYISSVTGRKLNWDEYTVWIRSSTGHLCVDLTPPETNRVALIYLTDTAGPSGISLWEPPSDSEMIHSVSLQNYHEICYWHLCRWHFSSVSTNVSVKLGSVRHFSGTEYESSFEIASTDCRLYNSDDSWSTMNPIIKNYLHPINCNPEGTTIMTNGYIRINSAEVVNEYRHLIQTLDGPHWLKQANGIFNGLGITCGFEDFVFIDSIVCWVTLSGLTDNLPPGYLFLCPSAELETEDPTCFRIPNQPAYWSFDPSGVDRLSEEVAEELGFPAIHVQMIVHGTSWDVSIYDGIRQFHEAKGIDPYSQEVALELEYPRVRSSCSREALFAHLQENDSSDGFFPEENLSGSGDGQSDSISFVVGDAVLLQAVEFKSRSFNGMEDVTSGHDDTDKFPHVAREESTSNDDQCYAIEAEMLAPSRSFNIVMALQFILILAVTAIFLYDFLFHG